MEYNACVSLGNCSWAALDGMAGLEKWLLSALCKYQTNYSLPILRKLYAFLDLSCQNQPIRKIK